MNGADVASFVAAAAYSQGLVLDADQLQRVIVIFSRNAELAQLVLDFELPESTEPAPVFRP